MPPRAGAKPKNLARVSSAMVKTLQTMREGSSLDLAVPSRSRQKANELEAAWKLSEKAYHARQRKQTAEAWILFHLTMAESILKNAQARAESHRARAEQLLAEDPA